MHAVRSIICCLSLCTGALAPSLRAELWVLPERLADTQLTGFLAAVEKLHASAVRAKKPWREDDLHAEVPRKYLELERRYAGIEDPRQRAETLAQLALIYAELAWIERLTPLEEELKELNAEVAARLGHFAASEHCFARVVGTDPSYASAAVKLGEAAYEGYRKLFGFEEISKVPGKKIRIVIHVDPALQDDRLYFHPSPPYHSELRFFVPDAKYLTLAGGRRIVYGFCHELGHMVAMWGEHGTVEDDRHAWAHYTGCLVVEEVYDRLGDEPWPTWTAFQRRASGRRRLLSEIEGVAGGTESYEAILALFHRIGETWGTQIYGEAWKLLEKKGRIRRLQRVPYLWLHDLRDALLALVPRGDTAKVAKLFAGR